MADEMWISETKARGILVRDGDFTPAQANIVLGHSRKQDGFGTTYYPATYIVKRAQENAARVD